MTTTCTNPTCSITLAPGATKCWLCGTAVEQPCDVEAEDAFEAICKGWPFALRTPGNLENCRTAYRAARRPLVEEVARLRAEIERLYKACRCWRVDFERVEEERDDLRAKLEAAEKLSEQRRLQIFDLHMQAAERRQPVDRSAAMIWRIGR